jgi:simple sugar transport system substrate-binding protein
MAVTRRRTLVGLAAATSAAAFSPIHRATAQIRRPRVAVVAKVADSPWFDAMETGIKKGAQEHNVDAWIVRPVDPDPAHQVRAAEDLIEQKVDVLAVVPNDATALAPVFARARASGMKVITHESPAQNDNDWDIELATIDAQAEKTVDALAFNMGGAGKYIIIVGSLVVPLHNAWADASIAMQKTKYPDMNAVPGRFGVGENLYDSYKTVLDQIRAHPDLKGILAYGSQGPIGAARALNERGKGKQIALVGTFLPRQGASYVKEGTIRVGYLWSPILAGRAIVHVGAMLVRGEQPVDGMELPGLGQVRVFPERRLIQASKLETVNRRTIDHLIAAGL